MNLNKYQQKAFSFAAKDFPDRKTELTTWGLGLVGETGEVAEHIKKYLGHGHELDPVKVCKELGDVVWYCAAIASFHGIDLEKIGNGCATLNRIKDKVHLGIRVLRLSKHVSAIAGDIELSIGFNVETEMQDWIDSLSMIWANLASIATYLELSIDEVLQRNIDKLSARYPQGFSSECSINRKESA